MKKFSCLVLGLIVAFFIYFLGIVTQKNFLPDNTFLFSMVTFVYLISSIFYLLYAVFNWEKAVFIGSVVGWGGFLGNILGILIRWIQTHQTGFGYVPLSNLYESLVFFSACIAGIYLFWEFNLEKKFVGFLVFVLSFLILAFANLKADPSIKPLIPALKSNWLIAHVTTCFLGYGAFAIAFAVSILNLLSEKNLFFQKFLPEKEFLDNFTYKSILFGFFWLTVGIITGAIWADQAWGSYWSWDPKETWSLITWLIYATTIHLRLTRGWSGKKLSWLSVLGFLSVLFTYFGVNFLLSGLHSYGNLS